MYPVVVKATESLNNILKSATSFALTTSLWVKKTF